MSYLPNNKRYGSVYIYAQSGHKQKPIGSLTGLALPMGLAVDGNGDLYVADEVPSGEVLVFHQGETSPYKILTDTRFPVGVAVDSEYTVYVTEQGTNTIVLYENGSTLPTSTLTANTYVQSIAVDNVGDVFVASLYGIEEFPAGSTTPQTLQFKYSNPFGIALDASQNLVVANNYGASIEVIAPPYDGAPIKQFTTKGEAFGLALSADDSALWFSDHDGRNSEQLRYPNLKKLGQTARVQDRDGSAGYVATYPAAPL
jgi:sugar lactone lactonase YvrE